MWTLLRKLPKPSLTQSRALIVIKPQEWEDDAVTTGNAPLKIDMSFDEAMRRTVRVPPKPQAKKAKAKKKMK